MLKPSEDLIKFIKQQEGLRLKKEKDFDGKDIIGYGDTENVPDTITETEADAQLRARLNRDAEEIARLVRKKDLTQSQVDVLFDIKYNTRSRTNQRFFDVVNSGSDNEITSALSKYTKGLNQNGELVELPGLVDRSRKRVQMWTSGKAGTEGMPSMADPQSLIAQTANTSIDGTVSLDEAIERVSIVDEKPQISTLDQAINNVKIDEAPVSEENKRLSAFDNANDLSQDQKSLEEESIARKLSLDEGIPLEEAKVLLSDDTPENIKLNRKKQDLVKYFPKVSTWAAKPENQELLKKSTIALTQIESISKPLDNDYLGDAAKLFKQNFSVYDEGWRAFKVTHGLMNPDEFLAEQKEAEKEKKKLDISVYKKELEKSNQTIQSFIQSAEQFGEQLTKTADSVFSEKMDAIDELGNLAKSGAVSAERSWQLVKSIFESPGAYVVQSAQSVGSAAAPWVGTIAGGGAGLATGIISGGVTTPIAVARGAMGAKAGAGLGSGLLSYSTYLSEELQQFRDPNTGELDEASLRRALANPALLKKWKFQAGAYGLSMGALDYFATGIAGKFLTTAKGAGKVAVVKGLAKGAASQMAIEGVSEFGGRTGADFMGAVFGDELTFKQFFGNMAQGTVEGAYSLIPSTVTDIAGAGVRKIADKTLAIEGQEPPPIPGEEPPPIPSEAKPVAPQEINRKLKKIVKSIDKANDATENFNILQRLREKIAGDPELKNNSEKVKELIDAAIEPQQKEFDIDGDPDFDFESESETTRQELLKEAESGIVQVLPKEWDAFHQAIGVDPNEAILNMGEDVARDYAERKTTNSSFSVPISDWLIRTQDTPNIDAIIRVNDSEINTVEAATTHADFSNNATQILEQAAFHGSQFRFDKFSLSKIGEGLGSQGFGYGLYFTSEKEVAEYYREILTDEGTGQVYKTEIPDAESFIDFSGLVKDQPEAIQKGIQAAFNELSNDPEVQKRIPGYKNFVPEFGNKEWDDVLEGNGAYNFISKLTGSDKAASQLLNKYGIEGVKYQGELNATNFVVFDDSKVSITQTFYQPTEGGVPPVIPGQVNRGTLGGDVDLIPATEVGEPTLRPVRLYNKFRNDAEKKVFQGLLGKLKAAQKKAGVDPKAIEIMAELEFRHMRKRARLLNTTVEALYDSAKFNVGYTERAGVAGIFAHKLSFGMPVTVAFSKYANVTTQLHEFGHSWLHEMSEDWVFLYKIPEDQLTDEQREYKEVITSLVNLYNQRFAEENAKAGTEKFIKLQSIADLYSLGKDQELYLHESFAQTSEKYFLEGKFENNAFKKILEFYRKWLTKIAEYVGTSYKEFPALNIDAETERLFTVLLDADNKIEDELIPMFSEPEFSPGFLGKDYSKYKEALDLARSEAIAEFWGKIFKKDIKERDRLIQKAKDGIIAEVTEQVDQMPSMRLLGKFRQNFEMYRSGQIEQNPAINYTSFVKIFANGDEALAEQMKTLMPPRMVAPNKKGGVNIEDLMVLLGVNSVDEMKNLLLEAGKREQIIESLVEKRIAEEIPAFKTDDEIHEIAVEAVQSKGKEALLRKTFEILKDKFPAQFRALIRKGMLPQNALGDKEIKNYLKKKADILILNTSVKGFNPRSFLKDSDKLGRFASSLFTSGKIEEGFDAKYNQSLNFYAYQRAMGVINDIAKVKTLIMKKLPRMMRDKTMAKKYDPEVMQIAIDAVTLASQGSLSVGKISLSSFSSKSRINQSHVDVINSMVDMVNALGADRAGDRTSVAAYLAFGDLLNTVIAVARDSQKIKVGESVLAFEDAKITAMDEIGAPTAADPIYLERFTKDQTAIKTLVMGREYQIRTTLSVLSSLYKNEVAFTKSVVGKIFNNVKNAEALRNEHLDRERQNIINAMKKAFKKTGAFEIVVGPVTDTIKSVTKPKPIIASEINFTFQNKAELLGFLTHVLGNESNAKKVLRGGIRGSGPLATYDLTTDSLDMTSVNAMIDRLIDDGELTKDDFDLLQSVWDSFGSFYPLVKDALRDTDNRNIGYIEGKPFSNKLGSWKGGYIPSIKASDFMSQSDIDSMKNPDHEIFRANSLFPHMYTGMANNRNDSVYEVNIDLHNIVAKLGGVSNVAYLRKPMLDFGKMFTDPDFQKAIEARRPGILNNLIKPWYQRTKFQEYTIPSHTTANVVLRQIRTNSSLVFYGLNSLTALKQFTGIPQAIPYVGLRNITKGTANLFTQGNTEFIISKSPLMAQRLKQHVNNNFKSVEYIEANFNWLTDLKDIAREYMPILSRTAQSYTDKAVWMAAYGKAQDEGLSDFESVSMADNIVEKTQGATTVSGMANIQYGNEAEKILFGMMTSYPIAVSGQVYEAWRRNPELAKRAGALMVLGLYVYLIPTMLEYQASELYKEPKEDEDEEEKRKAKALKANMASNALNILAPIFGKTIAEVALYDRLDVSPGLSSLAKSIEIGYPALKKDLQGLELSAQETKAMLDLLTYGTGVPFTLLSKDVQYEESGKTEREKKQEARQRKQERREFKRQQAKEE